DRGPACAGGLPVRADARALPTARPRDLSAMTEVLTDRLRLRPFAASDVAEWHRAVFADDEVMRYLPSGRAVPPDRAREVFERFEAHRADHGFAPWAATRREDGALLGHCGLRHVPEAGEVEVVYALGREHW